jgi:hypothetical protein
MYRVLRRPWGLRAAVCDLQRTRIGPSRDATTGEDAHSAVDDKKANAGENRNSEDADRDGSANSDMTKSKKRVPIGPTRGGPEDAKQ